MQLYTVSSYYLSLCVHLALVKQRLCSVHFLPPPPSLWFLLAPWTIFPLLLSDPPLFLIAVLCSVSHILLDSSLGLMLMTHHPTWKHFLCECEGVFAATNENSNKLPHPPREDTWKSKEKNLPLLLICKYCYF